MNLGKLFLMIMLPLSAWIYVETNFSTVYWTWVVLGIALFVLDAAFDAFRSFRRAFQRSPQNVYHLTQNNEIHHEYGPQAKQDENAGWPALIEVHRQGELRK